LEKNRNFKLLPVRMAGCDTWNSEQFGHEVAKISNNVYDSTLKVNQSSPEVPAGMPRETDYKDAIWDNTGPDWSPVENTYRWTAVY